MKQDILTAAFSFLLNDSHEKVIYGVLKRLHISPQHNNYEDLYMEGCLLFVQAYQNYVQTHERIDEHALLLFAYQKIRWGLLDILRRESLHQQRTGKLNNLLETIIDPLNLEEHYFTSDKLNQLLKLCSWRERRYLDLRYRKDYSITEISQHLQVSRTAVYKWQKSISAKAKKLHD
ncbi:sigma-70 family RNA polymerase sigma factor [Ligilactobacillus sp. WILCCON 0076]|uniref:Sigma-70 family RNA polymerase sigma factor n=1 Tax=Ligilactobacillus ubinensis TaxID=2876789 RepID=A0A9X2FMF8_9LACO|nr:sigma-70 family RNA polymerase sigma factor [Ligilactobacillus ubinensis]MCP0887945.1 sigma-70 family RNA polymerase sigma factor [Ligilactobacillus ubinensis]